MKYEVYKDIEVGEDLDIFDFVSSGSCGDILKRVSFAKTDGDQVYNLAFGDVDDNGDIDDLSITANGDRNKVLATVALIVDLYTRKYPERRIFFQGSTPGRTRLYRMALGLNLAELSAVYDIWCRVDDQLVSFCRDVVVTGFVIKRKVVPLEGER